MRNGIFKRGKIFWLRYYNSEGKLYRESSKSTRKRTAEKLLHIREQEILDETFGFKTISFISLVKAYIENRTSNSDKNMDSMLSTLKHIKRYFKDYNIKQITTIKIEEYKVLRISEKAANSTVNHEIRTIRAILNNGLRKGLISKSFLTPNFKDIFIKSDQINIRSGIFKKWEYDTLLKALPFYLKPILILGYATGMRKGEMIELTWERVDINQGTIELRRENTKTNQYRKIKVHSELKKMFKELWDLRRSEIGEINQQENVFLNEKRNNRLFQINPAWNRYCKECGLEGKLIHDLRRSGITNLIESGVSESVAMKISGHKTNAMIKRYQIVSDKILEDAMERSYNYVQNQTYEK